MNLRLVRRGAIALTTAVALPAAVLAADAAKPGVGICSPCETATTVTLRALLRATAIALTAGSGPQSERPGNFYLVVSRQPA